MLKLVLLKTVKTSVFKFAVTVGLSAMALLSPANSDAAEARHGKASKDLKLGPGLPLGPQWYHDTHLEKPKLLLSPREKESAMITERMGPLSGAGTATSRGPSSVNSGSRALLSDYYMPGMGR